MAHRIVLKRGQRKRPSRAGNWRKNILLSLSLSLSLSLYIYIYIYIYIYWHGKSVILMKFFVHACTGSFYLFPQFKVQPQTKIHFMTWHFRDQHRPNFITRSYRFYGSLQQTTQCMYHYRKLYHPGNGLLNVYMTIIYELLICFKRRRAFKFSPMNIFD